MQFSDLLLDHRDNAFLREVYSPVYLKDIYKIILEQISSFHYFRYEIYFMCDQGVTITHNKFICWATHRNINHKTRKEARLKFYTI